MTRDADETVELNDRVLQAKESDAQVFVSSNEVRTITSGLTLFIVEDVFFWGPMMGAAVLSTLPPVILYLVFQRWVVKGLTLGAVKG